eukprot:CAMPEP_0198319952 /NCGR_PEP_ID=MMETSP1450-20131203/8969_1 /TAXON_ID=753684 ORGANISM="Madagascaria erythrocladiodes, Strain CCMP3234" /NCGR_SAMPLE_ID=MMETSP1450 /ASSEMBLY_ACC=CAM_ASM_001115 /LENGTH=925 /DNA_ID=CAMNT_0044023377 /DNA_START=233 /DNA_END=3010 /DNA_ORIENTATION=-
MVPTADTAAPGATAPPIVNYANPLARELRYEAQSPRRVVAPAPIDSGYVQWGDGTRDSLRPGTSHNFNGAFNLAPRADSTADEPSWDPVRKLSYSTASTVSEALRESTELIEFTEVPSVASTTSVTAKEISGMKPEQAPRRKSFWYTSLRKNSSPIEEKFTERKVSDVTPSSVQTQKTFLGGLRSRRAHSNAAERADSGLTFEPSIMTEPTSSGSSVLRPGGSGRMASRVSSRQSSRRTESDHTEAASKPPLPTPPRRSPESGRQYGRTRKAKQTDKRQITSERSHSELVPPSQSGDLDMSRHRRTRSFKDSPVTAEVESVSDGMRADSLRNLVHWSPETLEIPTDRPLPSPVGLEPPSFDDSLSSKRWWGSGSKNSSQRFSRHRRKSTDNSGLFNSGIFGTFLKGSSDSKNELLILVPFRRLSALLFKPREEIKPIQSELVGEEEFFDYDTYDEDLTLLEASMVKISIVLDKDERHFFELRVLKEADRIACANWLTENFSCDDLDRGARRLDIPVKTIAARAQRRPLTELEREDLLAYHQRIQTVAEAITILRIRDAENDVLRTSLKEDATIAAVLEPPDLSQQLSMIGQKPGPKTAPRFICFEDMYMLHSLIGRGRTGEVWLGYRREGQSVDLAVKVMLKGNIDESDMKEESIKQARIREEVEITKLLHHPNVIRTHDFFDNDDNRVYIVMDLMKGGTLTESLLRSTKGYSEAVARNVMSRILRGVAYIHDEGIIHRDIRPGNVLCAKRTLPCEVKLSDFGFAKDIVDGNDGGLHEGVVVGSALYHSPEIAKNEEIGPEVDVWACGVIMYFLLTGDHPFVGRNVKATYEKIVHDSASFRGSRWRRVSLEAQRLCRLMLDKERYRRIDARDALDHPWFKLDEVALASRPLNIDWEFSRYEMGKRDRSVKLELMEMFGLREDVPE